MKMTASVANSSTFYFSPSFLFSSLLFSPLLFSSLLCSSLLSSLAGKMPPDMGSAPSPARMSCNLIPSISSNSPSASCDPRSRLPQAAPRSAAVKKAEDREDQSNLIDLGSEPAIREYVNYHHSSSSPSQVEDEPAKDPFDMSKFHFLFQSKLTNFNEITTFVLLNFQSVSKNINI